MSDTPKPRTLDLAAVLAAAARAEEQMATWPQWKRELSRTYPVADFRKVEP